MKTQILIAVILFIILTGFSEFDFDGIPRTGKYPGDKPDIGAFEYDPNIGAFVYDPTSGDNDSGNNGSSSNSGCFVKTVNRNHR